MGRKQGMGLSGVSGLRWLLFLCLAGVIASPSWAARHTCKVSVERVGEDGLPLLERPAATTRSWVVIPHATLRQHGALYALSDVHAELAKVKTVFHAAGLVSSRAADWSAGNAILVVAGDLINKGEDSVQIVRFFRKLQSQAETAGGKVILLMGNHEAALLADPGAASVEFERSAERAKLTAVQRDELLAYLRQLPVGAFVGDAFFCHSGYLTSRKFRLIPGALADGEFDGDTLYGVSSILQARDWQNDESRVAKVRRAAEALGIRVIAFGHQTRALGRTGIVQSDDGFFIQLDPDWHEGKGALLKAASATSFSLRGAAAAVRVTRRGTEKPLHADARE